MTGSNRSRHVSISETRCSVAKIHDSQMYVWMIVMFHYFLIYECSVNVYGKYMNFKWLYLNRYWTLTLTLFTYTYRIYIIFGATSLFPTCHCIFQRLTIFPCPRHTEVSWIFTRMSIASTNSCRLPSLALCETKEGEAFRIFMSTLMRKRN